MLCSSADTRVRAASDSGVPVSEGNIIFHCDGVLCNHHSYGKLSIHISFRNLGLRQSISPLCQLTEAEHAVFAAVTVAITFPLASVNVNSALETALPLIPSTFFTQKPAKGMRAQTVLDSFTVGDSFV